MEKWEGEYLLRSSLFYHTSATRVQHEENEWKRSETRVTRVWHKCYTNDTSTAEYFRTTGVRYEWKTLILITAQVKTNFHTHISYMANKRLQGEEQFYFKNYLLEISRSQRTAKTELCNGKTYIKNLYTKL